MARGKRLLFFVVAIAFALVSIASFGRADYVLDAFQIRVSIAFFEYGVSELQIPPRLYRARTHLSPCVCR